MHRLVGCTSMKFWGRVAPFRKGKYLFDFRRINIYFLFYRTNSVRDLIFV
jgi:hypothetical protein